MDKAVANWGHIKICFAINIKNAENATLPFSVFLLL